MAARKEKLNEKYLNERVEETGGSTRKGKWVNRRGAPDRFIGWPHLGRSAWVEVKEEEQPWGLQDHQSREHNWLRCCGQQVWVLESRQQIDHFIAFMTRV